jgi:hypothetical protein
VLQPKVGAWESEEINELNCWYARVNGGLHGTPGRGRVRWGICTDTGRLGQMRAKMERGSAAFRRTRDVVHGESGISK